MPRPSNPAVRQKLLAAGRELIFARGFNGCGIQEITSAAGIPKGSFYNYFPTKNAFAVELLEDYWSSIEKEYGPILRNLRLKPLDRIKRYFRALFDNKERHRFTLGCLIGNLSLELGGNSEEARVELATLFSRWQEPLADCLREAQEREELDADRDVEELAAALIEAWEGAVMRSKVDRRRESYRRFETLVLPGLMRG
jgi:TetR/AcrR family transcriptional regulator, transcriptional repressor for nem operon